jgi:hypothetical protein
MTRITEMTGMLTPWGPAQFTRNFGNGVFMVETAGHGGIYVPPELIHKIPQKERDFAAAWSHGWGENWFEEDCAAISPAYHLRLYPDRMEEIEKYYKNQEF